MPVATIMPIVNKEKQDIKNRLLANFTEKKGKNSKKNKKCAVIICSCAKYLLTLQYIYFITIVFRLVYFIYF